MKDRVSSLNRLLNLHIPGAMFAEDLFAGLELRLFQTEHCTGVSCVGV